MRGTIVKLLRAFAKAGGGEQYELRAWWKGLPRPDREHAGRELRRRLSQFRAQKEAAEVVK